MNLSFDDSAWERAPGGIGFGDNDDGTSISPAISVYCRYYFDVPNLSKISALLLDMDFDDGFVAYLNGIELARYNMGEAGSTTSWNYLADDLFEAPLYRGLSPFRVVVDQSVLDLLVNQDNVLAIEVHNQSAASSDLSSNAYLHAGLSTADRFFNHTPSWFWPPMKLDTTLLPMLMINTNGQAIPDEPRITAHMGLIHNDLGGYNSFSDPLNVYNGQISIEIRGESSAWFYPKKSYSIETQTDSGTNNNVSLLGLPEENDFVLSAPYGDKTLMRNVLAYGLYEKFGHYAPRTRFVELLLNGNYQGLYVLTEKIKRDKNRVDMAKITAKDTTAIDISGGYLMRIDKTSGMAEHEYWTSPVQPPLPNFQPVVYQHFDPDYDELSADQRAYMKDYLVEFERVLVGPDFMNPTTGYQAYLDIPSFMDLMILNEVVKDVDGFRLSHYFYKQKDTRGGKLVTGPPWDYNLTFGNSDFTDDVHQPYNWTYPLTPNVYWWTRVMNDPWFNNQVQCRWEKLYTTVLSPESVSNMIDSSLLAMDDAISRNFTRWPIFGTYVWPNSYVGQNYLQEEEYLRTWINDRLSWIDGKWGGLCEPVSERSNQVISHPKLKVYPNPSDLSNTFVSLPSFSAEEISIRLFDINGRLVYQATAQFTYGEHAYSLPDLSFLTDGIYTLEVNDGISVRAMCKLLKQ